MKGMKKGEDRSCSSCFVQGDLLGAMQSVPRPDVRVGSYSSHQSLKHSISEMSDALYRGYA